MRLVSLVYFIFFINNLNAQVDCNKSSDLKVINFFKTAIKDKIIKTTPSFCSNKGEQAALTSKEDKLFETIMKEIIDDNKTKKDEQFDTLKDRVQIKYELDLLKYIILRKLWSGLNNQERLEVFNNPDCAGLNHPYLIDFEQEIKNEVGVVQNLNVDTFSKICGTSTFSDVIKYVDKKIIVEFFFVINKANLSLTNAIEDFCNAAKENLVSSNPIQYKDDFSLEDFQKRMNFYAGTNFTKSITDHASNLDSNKLSELKKEEVKSLKEYTVWAYQDMNDCLRFNQGQCKRQEFNDGINNVASALKKINGKVRISFRGVGNLSNDIIRKVKEGCIYSDPGFFSTSLNYNIAKNFTIFNGYLFVVRGKSGGYISPVSAHKTEVELLYPPGTKFIVNKVKPKNKYEPQVVFLEELDAKNNYQQPEYCSSK